jgi:hypothetical protein
MTLAILLYCDVQRFGGGALGQSALPAMGGTYGLVNISSPVVFSVPVSGGSR